MALSSTPHDSLFRALVSSPRRAAALLREHLPGDMTALIDFGHPPEPEEGSFVDGTGAKTQCDALFRVRLKGGQDARVYVLLEHKSSVDPGTPLQVAKYMLNIWTRDSRVSHSAIENGLSVCFRGRISRFQNSKCLAVGTPCALDGGFAKARLSAGLPSGNKNTKGEKVTGQQQVEALHRQIWQIAN